MKQLFAVLTLSLLATIGYGQSVGLGIGSDGISIKSNPVKDWRFMGRIDFSIGEISSVRPTVMVARQLYFAAGKSVSSEI